MTLRAQVTRVLSTALTSPARRDTRRGLARVRRRLSGNPATVHYFHQADDPYSHLAAQCLARLGAAYRIALVPHLGPPPDDSAAPERGRLEAYALRDAARVARRYGLAFPDSPAARNAGRTRRAEAALAQALVDGTFAAEAVRVGQGLWRGDPVAAPEAGAEQALAEGAALRARLGHYLGGMFQFEGEWYWGVDRLHHLEARLRAEGLAVDPTVPLVAPFQEMALDGGPGDSAPVIEFWFSYRSPYCHIAVARLHRLAAHYGATMRWRVILPMIMRGLPVPRAKSRYIMLDVKREAEILGLPFGTIVDPVGAGIFRANAVTHRAIQLGKAASFVESGFQAVFADGIDLATDNGLLQTARRAGLTDEDVRIALADDSWRAVAEENRKALLEAGLWGAPTYRVDDMPAHWGQDRLWALEEDLQAAIAGTALR